MKHTKTNGEKQDADTINSKDKNICPICGVKVRVTEPDNGGSVVHKGFRYHFNCYFNRGVDKSS